MAGDSDALVKIESIINSVIYLNISWHVMCAFDIRFRFCPLMHLFKMMSQMAEETLNQCFAIALNIMVLTPINILWSEGKKEVHTTACWSK